MRIILIAALLLPFGILNSQNLIKNASFDIAKYNIDEDIVYLDGNWEFYDNQLYTPQDSLQNKTKKYALIKVPALWNKVLKRGGLGYGTYRLMITSLQENELYALNINRIQSSYKLWVNGKLLKENGLVGANKEQSKPRWSSEDIVFIADNDSAEIIIQVSNFYHKKGGIEHSIAFGKAENIIEHTWNISALDFFLLGALLIMAAYHFAMFFFRKNDKSNLFFALTLVFTAIFTLTVGEILIVKMFPTINWQFLVKTNHGSNYWRLIFFVLFIYVSFKEFMNKYIVFGIVTISLLGIIFILLSPALIFSHGLIVFIILVAISLIYMIIGQIRALISRKAGALFSLLGVIVLLFTGFNDILNELQIIQSINLSTFGFFIFIILHSYLISVQNSRAYRTIKNFTKSLVVQGKIKDALFSAKAYKLEVPLKAIAKAVDTDRALIFILRDGEWLTTNEYLKEGDKLSSINVKIFSSKEDVYFSAINIKKAISSKEIVYTQVTDNLKASDIVYFEDKGIKSIFVFPLNKDNELPAILYFENYSEKPYFKKKSEEIMHLIMPQALTFMDNFVSYNKLNKFNIGLEEKVQQVTDDIQKRNKELKILRDETEKQNTKSVELSEKLEKQNQEINDGIRYAEKIQSAFLPKISSIKEIFPNSFIYHKTKEVLGGDFYWFNKINDNESIFAVADSTGYRVSGALMSIIGQELLNEAVIYNKNKSPKIILNTIQKEFSERISKKHDIGGMDLSVIYYNSVKQEVIFSGAQNSIYLIHNDNLIEYRATPVSIGGQSFSKTKKGNRFFTNNRISIKKGDIIYMFSDGFVDQIGHETNRKFMKNKFKELLSSIHKEPIGEQKEMLIKALKNWQGEENQTDDILVTGILF